MFRDFWFWLWLVTFIVYLLIIWFVGWRFRQIIRHPMKMPTDLAAAFFNQDITALRLCLRRLYYLVVRDLESGQPKLKTLLDAHALLKDTDFEIPADE